MQICVYSKSVVILKVYSVKVVICGKNKTLNKTHKINVFPEKSEDLLFLLFLQFKSCLKTVLILFLI